MREEQTRLTVCLTGDVMTGRGIDQILSHPHDPVLYERWVRRATRYVDLAEAKNGAIPRTAPAPYVWGELLSELLAADVRVLNLETAVTTSASPAPKGIHYRMHPHNLDVLRVVRPSCCVLANNHVADWGLTGLVETLEVLHDAGLLTAGAGRTRDEAERPALVSLPDGGRLVVYAFGHPSSGVPLEWAATDQGPGVNLLPDLSPRTAERITRQIAADRRAGDIVIASIHWGDNWGWTVPQAHRSFAQALVDSGAVEVIHGHSSHHPLGIEVHRDRPLLYGCGDLVNDYEGIDGYEVYRPDLALVYRLGFARPDGRWLDLEALPVRRERFRLIRATDAEARWLGRTLARESRRLDTEVTLSEEGRVRIVAGAATGETIP